MANKWAIKQHANLDNVVVASVDRPVKGGESLRIDSVDRNLLLVAAAALREQPQHGRGVAILHAIKQRCLGVIQRGCAGAAGVRVVLAQRHFLSLFPPTHQ